jgi:hypothetical protein
VVVRYAWIGLGLAVPFCAEAKSGVRVGLDLGYGLPLDAAPALGPVVGLDVGYAIGFGFGRLIPEIGFQYAPVSQSMAPIAGGAIFVGKFVEAGAFMHVVYPIPNGVYDSTALGFDAGVALDVTALPKVDVGLHLAGQWIGETVAGPDEAAVVGGHVGLTF